MELKHGFISVGGRTFGGNQMISTSRVISRCGCGVVSTLELILYLHRHHGAGRSSFFDNADEAPSPEHFEELVRSLRRYIPLMYPIGINGLFLATGVNLFFLRNRMSYRARWCIGGKKLWQRIEDMMANDIPVIISAGPQLLRLFRKKETLALRDPATGRPINSAQSHYMTVASADEEEITVSSWGRRYMIRKEDYENYARRQSGFLVSNILYVRPRKKKRA